MLTIFLKKVYHKSLRISLKTKRYTKAKAAKMESKKETFILETTDH